MAILQHVIHRLLSTVFPVVICCCNITQWHSV